MTYHPILVEASLSTLSRPPRGGSSYLPECACGDSVRALLTAAELPVRPVDVQMVAGAADNIFRTLHTLPGISVTTEFDSRLSVRGGGPDQNLTIMDGVEVHNPYRIFGLISAFNKVDGFFSEVDLDLFASLASSIVASVDPPSTTISSVTALSPTPLAMDARPSSRWPVALSVGTMMLSMAAQRIDTGGARASHDFVLDLFQSTGKIEP